MENFNCPNKRNHVSAFPAYDRELCPICHGTYILNVEMRLEQLQEINLYRKECLNSLARSHKR